MKKENKVCMTVKLEHHILIPVVDGMKLDQECAWERLARYARFCSLKLDEHLFN